MNAMPSNEDGSGTDDSLKSVFDHPCRPKLARLPSSKKRCVVLMPFSREFDLIWHYGIRLPFQPGGALANSWQCTRADEWGPGQIMEQIYQQIDTADAILVDLTGLNSNVVYELGYAHGKQHQAMLVNQYTAEGLPFDLRGYRVVWYEPTAESLSELNAQIVAWLSADLSSRDGMPRLALEPVAVVTAGGVPFALKNTGDGLATDVKVTWGKWDEAYDQPLAPGSVANLLVPHDWEFTKYVAEEKPLPGALQVEYRAANGTTHTQSWDVQPIRTKGMFKTEVQERT